MSWTFALQKDYQQRPLQSKTKALSQYSESPWIESACYILVEHKLASEVYKVAWEKNKIHALTILLPKKH